MKSEQLEKGVSLNNEIKNLEMLLKTVEDAIYRGYWGKDYISIIIDDRAKGSVYGKDVFDFLHGYLSLKLKAARAEFENL